MRAKIHGYLAEWGVEKRPDESVMEAFGRGLGMSIEELKEYLRQRASGSSSPRVGGGLRN